MKKAAALNRAMELFFHERDVLVDQSPELLDYAKGRNMRFATLQREPRLSLRMMNLGLSRLGQSGRDLIPQTLVTEMQLLAGAVDHGPDPSSMVRLRYMPGLRMPHACSDAEPNFISARDQIMGRGLVMHSRISVYYTPDGEPIMLRKKLDEATAMTLAPVRVDSQKDGWSMIFPAGTILAIFGDGGLSRERGSLQRGSTRFTSYEVDSDLAVRPVRLSPWAYNNELDRGIWGTTIDASGGHPESEYDPGRTQQIARRTIDDFREAACRVMDLCGVR